MFNGQNLLMATVGSFLNAPENGKNVLKKRETNEEETRLLVKRTRPALYEILLRVGSSA